MLDLLGHKKDAKKLLWDWIFPVSAVLILHQLYCWQLCLQQPVMVSWGGISSLWDLVSCQCPLGSSNTQTTSLVPGPLSEVGTLVFVLFPCSLQRQICPCLQQESLFRKSSGSHLLCAAGDTLEHWGPCLWLARSLRAKGHLHLYLHSVPKARSSHTCPGLHFPQ